MLGGFPSVFLPPWVISLSTFCLHRVQVLMASLGCWAWNQSDLLNQDYIKVFPCGWLFQRFPIFFFPPLSYCNGSSHLQISLFCRLCSFSIDGQTWEKCFQIDFFPLSAVGESDVSWGPGGLHSNCCREDREGAHLIRSTKRLSKDKVWKHTVVKSVHLNGGSKGTMTVRSKLEHLGASTSAS